MSIFFNGGIFLNGNKMGSSIVPPPVPPFVLLLEDGDKILLENGNNIALEA